MKAKNRIDGGRFQLLGSRQIRVKSPSVRLPGKRRQIFGRRRPTHDPMLVLNMSIFNSADGWDRIFNPLKANQYGTR
jgi:hypothetical protein